jgi:uncharacterized DUF497 family protein
VDFYRWNREKNQRLITERGISFEQIVMHIEQGDLLQVTEHPNLERYPDQRILVVRVGDYAYLVPFVESDEGVPQDDHPEPQGDQAVPWRVT